MGNLAKGFLFVARKAFIFEEGRLFFGDYHMWVYVIGFYEIYMVLG